MATLVWSAVNVIVAFYAADNLSQLWIVSLMIVFQYLTDFFDGQVGRQRNTWLIKWGFYMDHFLDFIFLCSLVFVGYVISPSETEVWFFGLLVVMESLMVNSFLTFGATKKFEIYHFGFGSTEMRMVFILINTFIIQFGTTYFYVLVPLTVCISFASLLINNFQIHKKLWVYDIQAKTLLN